MKVRITPKDSIGSKFEYEVKCWYTGYDVLYLVMLDGTIRIYPLQHIWYMEVL